MASHTAREVATQWLQFFNAKQLDNLLSLYADDAVHLSPKLRAAHPETEGKISGKSALRAWWQDAFDRLPTLHYKLTHLTVDGDRAVIEYVRQLEGDKNLDVAEILQLESGKIKLSRVYHG